MATKKSTERFVILRSNISGVWFGRLVESSPQSRILADARRAWNWQGAISCSELAITGPTGGKISGPVSRVEVDRGPGDEMCDASEAAVKAWALVPVAK